MIFVHMLITKSCPSIQQYQTSENCMVSSQALYGFRTEKFGKNSFTRMHFVELVLFKLTFLYCPERRLTHKKISPVKWFP